MNVFEIKGGNPNIGMTTRDGTSGPERDLIDAFLPFIPSCFRWRKGAVAIFHEPYIETGFPDLVVVHYNPSVFDKWTPARSKLRPLDLKLLHHLFHTNGGETEVLLKVLGLDRRVFLSAIERLLNAEMVTQAREKWMPRPLRSVFGIKTIVAIEAKIKNWSDAFQQAQLDQWFASETYVLSPIEKPSQSVLERSQRTGVGVLVLNGKHVRRLKNANKWSLPASYGSWMFNEWIGRYIYEGQVEKYGDY